MIKVKRKFSHLQRLLRRWQIVRTQSYSVLRGRHSTSSYKTINFLQLRQRQKSQSKLNTNAKQYEKSKAMKNSKFTPVLIAFLIAINVSSVVSKKIIFLNAFSSKSMKNFYEPLIEELANRGHQLTVISPFKASNKHPRIKDIIGPDIFEIDEEVKGFSKEAFGERSKGGIWNPEKLIELTYTICHAFHQDPNVKAMFDEKFDLVIATYSFNECIFGLIHHIGAPFILMHANQPLPYNNPTGLPHPLSFLPLYFLAYTDEMTFYQRTVNFALSLYIEAEDYFDRIPKTEAIYRQYLGADVPSVAEIAKNVNLIIANSHFSVTFPRPLMPDVIEVGGMHCKPAKELPADLKKFVEESGENGFIFFSMGSALTGSHMPEDTRRAFISAFSKLKQNVVWKWETETMPDLPKNVKLGKWLPQQDLLGHKNIRAFIGHGGLHSTEEAIYHGVPTIGIPMLFDQDSNMKLAEHFGFALTLEFYNITEEKITAAIRKVLDEPVYREKAKRISSIFRDRPMPPLEEAVFHVEYVLRHKGAPHLRSPARNLNFFQYHSLDVIATLVSILVAVLLVIYYILRLLLKGLYTLIFKSSGDTKNSKSKKLN